MSNIAISIKRVMAGFSIPDSDAQELSDWLAKQKKKHDRFINGMIVATLIAFLALFFLK